MSYLQVLGYLRINFGRAKHMFLLHGLVWVVLVNLSVLVCKSFLQKAVAVLDPYELLLLTLVSLFDHYLNLLLYKLSLLRHGVLGFWGFGVLGI